MPTYTSTRDADPYRRGGIRGALAALCLVLLPPLQSAADAAAPGERPRIGLALSGGGARGAAHIGVIRELERLRIPIDYVAGTSMGAIVGGLYASGLTTDELEEVLLDIDWDDIFSDAPDRRYYSRRRKSDDDLFQVNKNVGIKDGKLQGPTGLVQGRKLDLLLQRVTAPVTDINRFDDLPIPYRAVATNIINGQQVVLDHGNLAAAIRASMSIPGFLARVVIDGRPLVDGGIANNLPIDVVREMGADVVIAVDISTPLLKEEELTSAFSIVSQLSGFLTRQNTEVRIATLTDADVLIVPDLGDITTTSFKRAGEAVGMGTEAAVAAQASLQRYSVSEEQYRSHLAARARPAREAPVIDFVRIDNDSRVADEVLRARLRLQPGERLDVTELEQDIGELYGLEMFDTVRYDLVEEDGKNGIVITVREKPWGPRYLQFGLQFSSDFEGGNELGLVIGYTVLPINAQGGEWRTLLRVGDDHGVVTEWYQPFGADSPYFVLPQAYYLNERFIEYESEQPTSENRVERFGVRLEVGREFGTWGRLSGGVVRETGEVSTRIGESSSAGDFDGGKWFAEFDVDTLDNIYFPTSGMRGLLGWNGSRTGLGADSEFDQVLFDIVGAKSWERNTLLLGARYYRTVDGEAPLASRFRAGGLFLLPGVTDNSLTGQHLAVLRAGFQRRIRDLFDMPSYVAGTLQYGNVFQDEDDIDFDNGILAGSVYLGLDSVLGPIYLGYGRNENGDGAVYMSIGSRF